jgi:hypothetical protein
VRAAFQAAVLDAVGCVQPDRTSVLGAAALATAAGASRARTEMRTTRVRRTNGVIVDLLRVGPSWEPGRSVFERRPFAYKQIDTSS